MQKSSPLFRYIQLFAVVFGCVLPTSLRGQTSADARSIDDHIEILLGYAAENEDIDLEQLVEELTNLAYDPLPLNTASAQEFTRLPALTPLLARRIVRFRETFGAFAAVEELLAVEGISRPIMNAVRPFLTAETSAQSSPPSEGVSVSSRSFSARTLGGRLIQSFDRRLELGRGYRKTSESGRIYRGSPYRATTRARLQYGKTVTTNLTFDKDPGEPFTWEPDSHTYGFDFWSAHVAVRPKTSRLQTLVIGDFIPTAGQGLVFSSGRVGGLAQRSVRRAGSRTFGIRPYRSTGENRFLRGAAATIRLYRQLHVTAFASRRTLDASLTPSSSSHRQEVIRRVSDGLHRTPMERARKDVLGESLLGGTIAWIGTRGRWGITAYYSQFSHPFVRGAAPYQMYDFSGRTAAMGSFYGETVVGPSHWFMEIARAPDYVIGGLGGTSVELTKGFESLILFRHYPRTFVSLHGHGFGTGGRSQNETGIYTTLRLHRFDRWNLSASFDQFWFPWLRFNISRPTTGYTGTVAAAYQPDESLNFQLQLRSKTTEERVYYPERTGLLRGAAQSVRQTIRLHSAYRLKSAWRIRTRMEISRARPEPRAPTYTGSLLYQDLRWFVTSSLRLDGRVTLFNTEDYAARLYAYENDLLYRFSVPMLSGRGQRAYLLITWTVHNQCVLAFKYAVSHFLDRTSVGSGWDEVSGNRLREIGGQIRFRW